MINHKIKLWVSINAKDVKKQVLLLSFFSLVLASLLLYTILLFRTLLDNVFEQNEALNILDFIVLSVICLMIIIIFTASRNYSMKLLEEKHTETKEKLFLKILTSRLDHITEMSLNETVPLLNNEIKRVLYGIITTIPKIIFTCVIFVGSLAIGFLLNQFFFIIILSAILIVIIYFSISIVQKRKIAHSIEAFDKASQALVIKSIKHISEIKSYEAELILGGGFKTKNLRLFKAVKRLENNLSLTLFIASCIYIGVNLFIAIYGSILLSSNSITYGNLILYLIITQFIFISLIHFKKIRDHRHQMIQSIHLLVYYDELEKEEFHAINEHTVFESLVIEDLSFKNEHQYIIEKLSCRINKGSFIHIHGENGKAKSTLLKLLIGLYQPQEGFIFFTIGKDKFLCDATTRHLFSYAPKDNLMVEGTIRENLELYQKSTEENLVQACKIACIYDLIKDLPKGFDTILGEKGLIFSRDKIQRLAIARALLKNAPILLFDDITSTLDPATERKIFSSIKSLTKKTCFIISHQSLPKDLIDQSLDL